MKKFVALYRVSTDKQKDSNLGLLSQRSAIEQYILNNKGHLIKEFEEVQSGGNKDRISFGQSLNLHSLLSKRPVLLEAINYAKEHNAIILIKEITRLTRFALLFEYLIHSGVEFICVDYPNENAFMLNLRVKFGEQELIEVSKRTKAGLSKSKKVKERAYLNNTTDIGRAKAKISLSMRKKNNPNNQRAIGYISQLRMSGYTLSQIAEKLNKENFQTALGKNFSPMAVKRLIP